jgi:hypothetical protein
MIQFFFFGLPHAHPTHEQALVQTEARALAVRVRMHGVEVLTAST